MGLQRWRLLLPGLWAGWLLCVAALATPAAFALLPQADAGRVAGRMLAQEAYTSLALGVLLLVLERVAARRAVAEGRARSSARAWCWRWARCSAPWPAILRCCR